MILEQEAGDAKDYWFPDIRSLGGAVLVVHDTSNLRRLERLREEFVAAELGQPPEREIEDVIRLDLGELGSPEKTHQDFAVCLLLPQPVASRDRILASEVEGLGDAPPGLCQHGRILQRRLHEKRAGSDRPLVVRGRQARRDGDDRECHAAICAYDAPALLQHGGLCLEAAQKVRVPDGIEARVPNRHSARVGCHDPATARAAFGRASPGGNAQRFQRHVKQADVTAGDAGHIEPGPSRAGADVQETDSGTKAQQLRGPLCFRPRGPAGPAVVAAADRALDLEHDLVLRSPVLPREAGEPRLRRGRAPTLQRADPVREKALR